MRFLSCPACPPTKSRSSRSGNVSACSRLHESLRPFAPFRIHGERPTGRVREFTASGGVKYRGNWGIPRKKRQSGAKARFRLSNRRAERGTDALRCCEISGLSWNYRDLMARFHAAGVGEVFPEISATGHLSRDAATLCLKSLPRYDPKYFSPRKAKNRCGCSRENTKCDNIGRFNGAGSGASRDKAANPGERQDRREREREREREGRGSRMQFRGGERVTAWRIDRRRLASRRLDAMRVHGSLRGGLL